MLGGVPGCGPWCERGRMAPTRLFVLAHGLFGDPAHLSLLGEECRNADVLVHQSSANTDRTTDGVSAGGHRLADEIRAVAARNPSLRSISLVGNSLGGLYVRHAAALLHDHGLIAGLKPETLVTTGTPHLGVRAFTFVPVPRWLQPAASLVIGRTADDLLLRDQSKLLLEMSLPDTEFGAALGAFERRRCYANLRGDFMVPFGSAAMETKPWGWGVHDGDTSARALAGLRNHKGVALWERDVIDGTRDGIGVILETKAGEQLRLPRRRRQSEWIDDGKDGSIVEEEIMRTGLHAHAWSKVAVGFASTSAASPLAHNRLVALQRAGWKQGISRWVERAHEGAFVVRHCAEYLVADHTVRPDGC